MIFLPLFSALLVFSTSVLAICPLCTVAVGAGLGVAKLIGVGNLLLGVLLGGFLSSCFSWTITALNKLNIRFYGRKILVFATYYVSTLLPIYRFNLVGDLNGQTCDFYSFKSSSCVIDLSVCGIDKFGFGVVCGTLLFLMTLLGYNWLIRLNDNRLLFKGQRLAMLIAVFGLFSWWLY